MARVWLPSLAALKSFKDVLTFYVSRGRFFARVATGPLGPARTTPKKRTTKRFAAATYQYKLLTEEDRVTWRAWAKGSSYTWKDQFYARYIAQHSEAGQLGLPVRSFSATVAGGTLTLSFTLGNYVIAEQTGFGSLAFGCSPFGHASKFLGPVGAPLYTDYNVVIGSTIPQPTRTPTTKHADVIPCYRPSTPTTLQTYPSDTVPDSWITIPTTAITGSRRYASNTPGPVCVNAENDAWAKLLADPTIIPDTRTGGHIDYIRFFAGGNYTHQYEVWFSALDLDLTSEFSEVTWQFADDLKLEFTVYRTADLEPWKMTITLDGDDQVITFGDTEAHFALPASPSIVQITCGHNSLQPPSTCPAAPINNNTTTSSLYQAKVHVNPHVKQNGWDQAAPTLDKYTVRLERKAGYPPLVCPPITLEA